jgi:hypothetical protein
MQKMIVLLSVMMVVVGFGSGCASDGYQPHFRTSQGEYTNPNGFFYTNNVYYPTHYKYNDSDGNKFEEVIGEYVYYGEHTCHRACMCGQWVDRPVVIEYTPPPARYVPYEEEYQPRRSRDISQPPDLPQLPQLPPNWR